LVVLLYILFVVSGAAALVYEVVWARSLSLVFGGSHLAVTTVLAVFMGGLALGGWLLGRHVERVRSPLRLYGLLELGIALFAGVFALLMSVYPTIYAPLARLAGNDPLRLSLVRVGFAVAAMIVPTTLMGGTLPVLSRFVASRPQRLGRHLALLYGFNTLGAVVGTLAAGFVLLARFGVSRSLAIAMGANGVIGAVALVTPESWLGGDREPAADDTEAGRREPTEAGPGLPSLPFRLTLWGIGISGACALGYEVLWTRVLSLVVGTSVYSFTIMLVAFLAGIGIGSQLEGLLARMVRGWDRHWQAPILGFGCAQLAIGVTALATSYALQSLPMQAMRLQRMLQADAGEFGARQGTSFLLAFGFMAVPAMFMGLAFPLAGAAHARWRGAVGGAVGEVLAFNTVGAILGAAGSGFALIYLFGIERSLQMLVIVNIGLGLAVLASIRRGRRTVVVAAGAVATMLAAAAAASGSFGMWDRDFFAVFRNNQRTAFASAERTREAIANTDVLYYHEGINETISVIRPKGAAQAFIVNGRVEASTHKQDIQCQRTLGHLPMLAHPDPRRVFVLGLGTGMTLGATSIHPEVEQITLAEIERGVLPAARTFGEYNHHVLDNPKLRIVHNDGRNFLTTTRETFDVITADPIHPWSGGAAYLYTTEYFRTASEHLAPGGVICQWLPIYELTVEDVRSVIRTFSDNFEHVVLWLTFYDAELLGSNAPIVFDERRLAARFADERVAADLAMVQMGTPRKFLSYFVAGDGAIREFARGAVVNTDDNLWLEFSSPRSQGVARAMGRNVEALTAFRESLLGYSTPLNDPREEANRRAFWERAAPAARMADRVHVLALLARWNDPEFEELLSALRGRFPDYAPGRFLEGRYRFKLKRRPEPIKAMGFPVTDTERGVGELRITAVTQWVGEDRGVVMFVDNDAREIYGQLYLDELEVELDDRFAAIADRVFSALVADYSRVAGSRPPDAETTGELLRGAVQQALSEERARDRSPAE